MVVVMTGINHFDTEQHDRINSVVGCNQEIELATGVSQNDVTYKFLRMPTLHFMMLWHEVSWMLLASLPIELGWNRTNAGKFFKSFARGDTVKWWSAVVLLP